MLGIRHYKTRAIDLFLGDITDFACDAIVNAANESLSGGGGVDGAIHQSGGPSILAACKEIGFCASGSAVITTAGDLPALKLIHAVGPVWQGGLQDEARLLASAYQASLQLAHQHKLRHLSFPSISTGSFGYPVSKAAPVALDAIANYIDANPDTLIRRISLVLFSEDDYRCYQDALFQRFSEL